MTTASEKEKALIVGWAGDPDFTPSRAETTPSRAKSGAERAKDSRERRKFRQELAEVLIEVKRLAEWDEGNRLAINRARDRLLLDWMESVTSDGADPVVRATTTDEATNQLLTEEE